MKRKPERRMHAERRVWIIYAFAILIMLVLVFTSASQIRHSYGKTSNSSLSDLNAQQYDGGVTHTYRLNGNINPIDVNVGAAIYATPRIHGGAIYVATMGKLKYLQDSRYDLTNGSVVAINISTNKILWRDYLPNQIMTQPIIVGGLLIVGMSNNAEVPKQYYNNVDGMIAINTSTGAVIWNVSNGKGTTTGPDLVSPAYYRGLVIEPGMGTAVIYNATTGRTVHTVYTGLPDILSSPLLVDGVAYFGAGYANAYGYNSFSENISGVKMNIVSDERFFAVNVTTGNILWATRFRNAGEGLNDVSAAFADGTIVTAYLYQSDYENPWMAALNASNGRVLWEVNSTEYAKEKGVVTPYSLSSVWLNYTQNTISPITIWNGTAYMNSNFQGVLLAVNISTGAALWATPTGQDESNPNVFFGHYLITVSDGGMLLVINATNGRIVNQTFINMPHLASEPIITNDYAILSGMDGRIISLPLKSLIIKNI